MAQNMKLRRWWPTPATGLIEHNVEPVGLISPAVARKEVGGFGGGFLRDFTMRFSRPTLTLSPCLLMVVLQALLKMDCQGLVVRLIQDFVLLTTAVEVAQRWRELAEKLAKVSKQQMDAYEAPHRDKTGVVDSEVRADRPRSLRVLCLSQACFCLQSLYPLHVFLVCLWGMRRIWGKTGGVFTLNMLVLRSGHAGDGTTCVLDVETQT